MRTPGSTRNAVFSAVAVQGRLLEGARELRKAASCAELKPGRNMKKAELYQLLLDNEHSDRSTDHRGYQDTSKKETKPRKQAADLVEDGSKKKKKNKNKKENPKRAADPVEDGSKKTKKRKTSS